MIAPQYVAVRTGCFAHVRSAQASQMCVAPPRARRQNFRIKTSNLRIAPSEFRVACLQERLGQPIGSGAQTIRNEVAERIPAGGEGRSPASIGNRNKIVDHGDAFGSFSNEKQASVR